MSEKLHVLVVGPSRCGKTDLLHTMFVPKFERVISLDVNNEAKRYNPDVIECTSLDDILSVAVTARKLNNPRWHIKAVLQRSEYPALFRMLAPEYRGEHAPPSFTRIVGGLALECSESYVFIPNKGADPDVEESFFRNRHHFLSYLLAAQRPTTLNVVTRTQADILVAFRETDPNELNWLGAAFGHENAEGISQLAEFHCAMYIKNEGKVYWLDDKRTVMRVTTRYGEPQAAPPVRGESSGKKKKR